MLTDFHTLSPADPISQAVDLIISGTQTDFPVLDNEQVVGILTRSDLLQALSRQGQAAHVASIMRRDFETADAGEMLELAFARLQACNCHTMPVTSHGQLVGLLTTDNIGEFLMIQSALDQTRRRAGMLTRQA